MAFSDILRVIALSVAAVLSVVALARMLRRRRRRLAPQAQVVLQVAAYEASRRRHMYVEPQHVLFAALLDRDVSERVDAAGLLSSSLRDELEDRLARLPTHLGELKPQISKALAVAIRTAAVAASGPMVGALDLVRAVSPTTRLSPRARAALETTAEGPYRSLRAAPAVRVHVWNDGTSTMEGVLAILGEVFGKPPEEAMHLMLTTHHTGSALVGEYSPDVGAALVHRALEQARARGMPLRITVEASSVEGSTEPPRWLSRVWRYVSRA